MAADARGPNDDVLHGRAMEARIGGIRLPITPSTFHIVYEGHYLNHQIISKGRISTPRGREPRTLTWKGLLPGKRLSDMLPFVLEPENPDALVITIANWVELGTRIKLTIVPSEVNMLIYVRRFSPDIGAPYFSREYEITVEEVRTLDLTGSTNPLPFVREVGQPGQVFVVPGNYNWRQIAADTLGNPDRWQEVMNANRGDKDGKGRIDVDDSGHVPPGVTVNIPRR